MTGYPQGFSKDLVETDPPAQVLQPGGNLPLLGQGSWAVRQWAAVEGGPGREVGVESAMHCEGGSPGAR